MKKKKDNSAKILVPTLLGIVLLALSSAFILAQSAGEYTLPWWNEAGQQKTNFLDFDGKNVIYVSKGTAATDTRTGLSKYDATRPFATIGAAAGSSADGDTIYIEPGTYSITDTITITEDVDVWCAPGVVVESSDDFAAIYFTNPAPFDLRGGTFISSDGAAIAVEGSNPLIDVVYAESGGSSGPAIEIVDCDTYFVRTSKGAVADSYDGIVIQSCGTGYIAGPQVIGADDGIEISSIVSGAKCFIDVPTISGGSTANSSGIVAIIGANNATLSIYVDNANISSGGTTVTPIYLGDGSSATGTSLDVLLNGGVVTATGANSSAVSIEADAASTTLTIQGTQINAHSGATNAIQYVAGNANPASVVLSAARLNKPIHTSFTVLGTYSDTSTGFQNGFGSQTLTPSAGVVSFDGARGNVAKFAFPTSTNNISFSISNPQRGLPYKVKAWASTNTNAQTITFPTNTVQSLGGTNIYTMSSPGPTNLVDSLSFYWDGSNYVIEGSTPAIPTNGY